MNKLTSPVWIMAAIVGLVLQSKVVVYAELLNETLVTTVNERLLELYIDGQLQPLINGFDWNLPDYTQLQPTNRLIAMEVANINNEQCGGVLSSVYDGSFITNNEWKCTLFVEASWTNLGYDDSNWPNATEYGSNGDHSSCGQQQFIGNISSDSKWIWTNDLADIVVYCRGYLPFCENSDPCLNDGICLKNDVRFCDCLPQFTGTQCETELYNETLVITANEQLGELYIDGVQQQSIVNGNNWNQSDYVEVQPMSRLIALEANNNGDPLCGGVLASIYEAYALTNSNWKCTTSIGGDTDWTRLGYDDSGWSSAVEYGSNAQGHSGCPVMKSIVDIDLDARWIWTNYPSSDLTVHCRGYLPFCETKSPCLNNGTCLENSETFCDCLPQYTGEFCETEMPTTIKMTGSFTTEITTEFTTVETSLQSTSDEETLPTTMNGISTDDAMETSGIDVTTAYLSTEKAETTEQLETTDGLSTNLIETTVPIETTVLLSTNKIVTTDSLETTEHIPTSTMQTTDQSETTQRFSTSNKQTTDPSETTERISTSNIQTTDPADITERISTSSIQTTDRLETTQRLSTNSIQSTDPSDITERISTSSIQTTTRSETTTEYTSTGDSETTQSPHTTDSTSNLEVTLPTETPTSTEPKETFTSTEGSQETVSSTSQVALQTTETATTSDAKRTTEVAQSTATSGGPPTITTSGGPPTITTSGGPPTITTSGGPPTITTSGGPPTMSSSSRSTTDVDAVQTTSLKIDFSTPTWFSQADNISNTSPADIGVCPEELYCDGPIEKSGSSIAHCYCPSGYLDLNTNCCLNQWWIIGLTCICVGILIGIIIAVVACLRKRRRRYSTTHDDSYKLTSSAVSNGGSLQNGNAIAPTESSMLTIVSDPPSTEMNGHVPVGQNHHDNAVEVAPSSFSSGKIDTTSMPESRISIPDLEPTETVRLSELNDRKLVREDSIFNPLMIDILSSPTGRQFRPSLASVATDVDYSIQRPSIQYDNYYDQNHGF